MNSEISMNILSGASTKGTGMTLAISGLTGGAARPGDHASLTMQATGGVISATRWGSTLGGSEYGTGASPTDYTSGDGGLLYATATIDGADLATTAPIRFAPPVFTAPPAIPGTPIAGDLITFFPGNAIDAAVTVEELTLDGVDKSSELSGLDWDTSGEGAGVIAWRTRATNSGGTTLSERITKALAEASTSATSRGATLSWTGNRPVKTGIDGRAYIAVGPDTITVADITPSETTAGGNVINGAMLNPLNGDVQGFDERMGTFSSAKKVVAGTTTVSAGDIIVKSIAVDAVAASLTSAERRSGPARYAVFYIVDTLPGDDYFGPAPVGWTGRGTPAGYPVDIDAAMAGLRQYATAGHAAEVASHTEVMTYFDQEAPLLGMTQGTTLDGGYEVMAPRRFGGADPGAANYGAYIGAMIAQASLGIISDGWTAAEARAALVRMIRHGIDIYDPWAGSGNAIPRGDGGHYQWALTPSVYALKYTGRENLITSGLEVDIPNNQLHQAFTVNAAQRAEALNSHALSGQAHATRRRSIVSVSGNAVTVNTFNPGDPPNMRFDRMLMQSASSATRSLVVDGSEIIRGPDQTVAVADGAGFAAGDEVYFLPPFAINEGDHDWLLESVASFNTYAPSATASYRGANRWSVDTLTIRALGVHAPVFTSMEGMVVRKSRAGQPSADLSYPDMHWDAVYLSGVGNADWAEAFWNDHAGALVPGMESAPPTIVAASPANGAVDVAANGDLVLTLSKDARFGSGRIRLFEDGGSGFVPFATYDLSDPGVFGTSAGQIGIAGPNLTLYAPPGRAAGASYAVEIDPGALTDLNYNVFAGITDTATWAFTMESSAGLVISGSTQAVLDTGSTLTLPVPVHNPGDLLVAILLWEDGVNNQPDLVPPGWTLDVDGAGFSGGSAAGLVYTRVAGASEPASYDWQRQFGNQEAVAAMLAVTGASGIDATFAQANGFSNSNLSTGSITPIAGAMPVYVGGTSAGTTTANTPPDVLENPAATNWSMVVEADTDGSGAGAARTFGTATFAMVIQVT